MMPHNVVEVFNDCPACHQGILQEWPSGWSCSRHTLGCRFHLSRVIAGHALTILEAYTLLIGRQTPVLSDLHSRQGHPFRARLELANRQTGSVRFVPLTADSA